MDVDSNALPTELANLQLTIQETHSVEITLQVPMLNFDGFILSRLMTNGKCQQWTDKYFHDQITTWNNCKRFKFTFPNILTYLYPSIFLIFLGHISIQHCKKRRFFLHGNYRSSFKITIFPENDQNATCFLYCNRIIKFILR